MAIQQVGGRGVYVITGSGRDPRKTSNGQSWADLVTKQKYMLYKSAYDQAMREYESGVISNKEKEKRIKDMRKALQDERDDVQSAMNQLERDELKANEVRERNMQKYDAETSLVTTSTPSSRSSRQSKIPNKQEYEENLQDQKRKINKDNQILQRQQTVLADQLLRLGVMRRSASGALQKIAAPKDQQEQEYNNIFDEIERNRITTGKINTELDLIGDKTNLEFADYYQKNRAPIQESGSVSQGSTSSKYRSRPIMKLDPVDYTPEMQAKQKRLDELKAEMDALELDLDQPIDVIDRTREIYRDKFGRGFRSSGAQQPARQPVQQPARQPVQQPASQEIQELVQEPDEQPVQREVSDPYIRRGQTTTPNRTAEMQTLGVQPSMPEPQEEEIYTDMGDEVSYGSDQLQENQRAEDVAKESFSMPQTYAQIGSASENLKPVTDMGTGGTSPITEALDRIETERLFKEHLAQLAAEDEFQFQPSTAEVVDPTDQFQFQAQAEPSEINFQPSTPEVVDPTDQFQFQAQAEPSEVNFQPSTPEVVDPYVRPEYGLKPVPTEIGDKLREIYPTPSPTPIPQQLQRLDRIPLFNRKQSVTEQPLTASKLVSQAFDEVRNLSTKDKQRVALKLLQDAKNQFGVTSKEYKKAKTVILKELAKAIDPKKAQQMQKVKKLQENNPSQYFKMGDNINGLSKDTKMLVQSLFAVNNDTKLSEIESLYQNAEQQIKMRVEDKRQKKKALEMLELMYLAVIQDNR